MTHEFPVRVFYEDTDLGGVVYYANYLKFIERGRSDWIEQLGIDQNEMRKMRIVFVVRSITADYLIPARLNDRLIVKTTIEHLGKAEIRFSQNVWRDDIIVFKASVSVVCITTKGRITRLPAAITTKLLHHRQ